MIRPVPDPPVRLGGGRLPEEDHVGPGPRRPVPPPPSDRHYYRCAWACDRDGNYQVLARRNARGAGYFLSQAYCFTHARHYANEAAGNGYIDIQVLEIR